ncbi:hypothetical protein [Arcobacter sp. CECT 8985]|uniref:hypothetical protein n=1 Tax=Arcobacter sp. CECT 8985 TaxID=1935424 RepID=UPI00100BA087|nr:hypothetical protein [Arcobacter sp. CECT 8985]RXJ88083.1 hypothetical protein CRU93_00360 [Arcobacter sp. CECT 8985]
MKLKGITIDFYDKRTCGFLPDLCLYWDIRSEELEDNEKLLNYWEDNLKKVLAKTEKIVSGNIDGKSIIYSADEEAIKIIKEEFKDLELTTIDYEDIKKCENCLKYDYIAQQNQNGDN